MKLDAGRGLYEAIPHPALAVANGSGQAARERSPSQAIPNLIFAELDVGYDTAFFVR